MIVCPICTDDLSTRGAVACPCGHVFHSDCLYRWLAKSHTCPECRAFANADVVLNLYFNYSSVDVDPRQLEAEVSTHKEALANLQAKYDKDLASSQAYVETLEDRIATYGNQLTEMINNNEMSVTRAQELERRGTALCYQLQHFHNIQRLLYCSQSELESILDSITREPDVLKEMLYYSNILEKQLLDISKSEQKQECKMETDLVPHKETEDISESKEKILKVGECSYTAESSSSSEDIKDVETLLSTGSPSNEPEIMLPDSSSPK